MIVPFHLIRNIYMNGIPYIKLYMNMNTSFKYLHSLLLHSHKKENTTLTQKFINYFKNHIWY